MAAWANWLAVAAVGCRTACCCAEVAVGEGGRTLEDHRALLLCYFFVHFVDLVDIEDVNLCNCNLRNPLVSAPFPRRCPSS